MNAKSLENLLNPCKQGDLGDIVRRARDMGELTQMLARALPADLADSLSAANIRPDGELVVICRSSAWASRLRFEVETLLDAARATGASVERCSVRVGRQDRHP